MRDWAYRARLACRDVLARLGDHARLTGLIGALALVALLYAAFFLRSPFATEEMVILQRRAPHWNTIVFNLDREYSVRTIEVIALADDGTPGETVWLLRRDDAPDMSTFAYGQQLGGMTAVTPAQPLTDGASYRLQVTSPGARGEIDFEFRQSDAVAGRSG